MNNVGRMWLAVLGCLVMAAPAAGQPRHGAAPPADGTLRDRMHAFLRAVQHAPPEELVAFFPRAGDLTWVHTLHEDEGRRVSIWRFPPSELGRALEYDGPLWASFTLQVERQPVGLFQHQVMLREAFTRRNAWRLVRGARFVPAGEPATAGLFVEWRREAGVWVVSAFGDERYRVRDNRKLPRWCC